MENYVFKNIFIQLCKTQNVQLQNILYSPAPFDGTTTFKESFVGPTDVRVRDSCRPKQTLIKNQQPLEGSTEYNDKYLPKSFEHRVRYPTPDWLKRRQCK